MPLLKLGGQNKQAMSIADSGSIIDFLTGGNGQKFVSADEALHNSDVFSLIMQLSGDLAMVRYTAPTDRAQGIIDNPTQLTNGFAFWQAMFAQLLLDGNAYAFRHKNNNGVDLSWEYLRPSQVEPMMLQDGSGMLYNINFDEPSIGYMQNVPANYMIHIRLLSKTGGMTGISPLSALADEMNIKDASNALTLKALKASISANGVLKITHGGLLDAKKKAARSRQFKQQTDLSDGGPIVIDDLEDYQPLEIRSNIAQLLSQTDWTSKQIAKVYGIPDSYLNGQGDQQSSITQIGGQYAKALNRYVQAILGELNNKLNVKISADIRTAIDAMGDQYATTISGLAKDNTIAPNQARFILQQSGYLPSDLPDAGKTAQPVIQINPNQQEGGDSEDEDN